MDLFIVLLILHVIWMLIWSLCLPPHSTFQQHPNYNCLHNCHHYQQQPYHQQQQLMIRTTGQPNIKQSSTQNAKHKLEKVLLFLYQTLTIKIVEAVKTLFHFLSQNLVAHSYQRHKIKLLEPVTAMKWTQTVIILVKQLSTKIIAILKILTLLKLNSLVLHLNLLVKKRNQHPELNASILQTHLETLKTCRNNKILWHLLQRK